MKRKETNLEIVKVVCQILQEGDKSSVARLRHIVIEYLQHNMKYVPHK